MGRVVGGNHIDRPVTQALEQRIPVGGGPQRGIHFESPLVGEILQLTSTVAHDRSRPAAPVTAFLIGLAAGRAGTDPTELIAAVRERAASGGKPED